MRRFVVNSLAQASQCQSVADVEKVLRDVIACIDYLLPALLADRAILLYDSRLDGRSLIAGESFKSTISRLTGRNGNDLRRKWYVYTKNRARRLVDETIAVALSSDGVDPAEIIVGPLDKSVHQNDVFFISFGGLRLLESPCLEVSSAIASSKNMNAHALDSLTPLLPQYQPSKKHRKEAYFDAERNEPVGAMPLSDDEAQQTLLRGVEHGGDYWSYHQGRGAYFRFKVTLKNVYHGFEVPLVEVPNAIVHQL